MASVSEGSGGSLFSITVVIGSTFIVCGVSYLILGDSDMLLERMGRTGTRIMSRIMGLLLAAIAVQFISNGLMGLFEPWLVDLLNPETAEMVLSWSTMSGSWDRFYRANPVTWRGPKNFELPSIQPCSRVLDVGCGPGNMLVKGAGLGHRMIGLDLSPTALSLARDKLRARHLDAELIEGSFPKAAQDLGRFDCILLHHVLSSMTEKERIEAVTACKDLLEVRIISFLDLSVNDMRYGSGELIEERTFRKGNGIPEHFFTLDEAGALFGQFEAEGLRE